jgi:hypothetical protein
VLVRDVRGYGVLLATKVEELLPEDVPQLEALGNLEGLLVEGNLKGRYRVLLGNGVLLGAVPLNFLAQTGDGDADEVEAALG